ncbi:MAG: phosphoribosylaminoimidazolesuccinocarboxamide synthase [Verrucomicrobiota bacterium]
MEPLYEGKAKRLYATEDAEVLRMEYKDDATAFNAQKHETFENKGRLNKAITLLIYQMLEAQGVKTHLAGDLDEANLLVKKVEILMVEVIVRNVAAGNFSKRVGVEEGLEFKEPIVEFSYKSDELGDPLINTDYARELGLATLDECAELKSKALTVNVVLKDFFLQAGLKLVDFKIEFGRLGSGEIVLADEVSPDTCRLWDVKTGEKMDKDRFRQDLGGLLEGYEEVLRRLEA